MEGRSPRSTSSAPRTNAVHELGLVAPVPKQRSVPKENIGNANAANSETEAKLRNRILDRNQVMVDHANGDPREQPVHAKIVKHESIASRHHSHVGEGEREGAEEERVGGKRTMSSAAPTPKTNHRSPLTEPHNNQAGATPGPSTFTMGAGSSK